MAKMNANNVKHFDTGSFTLKIEPEDELTENMSVQLDSLCRMCARPHNSVANSSPTLAHQFISFFEIDIDADDGLPRDVCCSCSEELSHWEQVRSSVEQAQTCLKQLRDQQSQESQELNDRDENISSEHGNQSENFEIITVKVNPDDTNLSGDEENYCCSICKAEYKNYDEFMEHTVSCKEDLIGLLETDEISTEETPTSVPQKLHRPHSPNNPFQCGICPMKFKRPFHLSEHLKSHIGNVTIKSKSEYMPCPHCNMIFRTVKSIIKHVERHARNPNKQITIFCKLCKKEFIGRKKLEEHMKTHSSKYQCSICHDSFRHKIEFDEHIKIHGNTFIAIKPKKVPLPPPVKHDEVPIAPKVINKVNKLMPTTSSVMLTNEGPIQYVYLQPIVLNKDSTSIQSNTFQIQIAPNIIPSTSKASIPIAITPAETKSVELECLPQSLRINVNDADYPCGFCQTNFKNHIEFGEHMENELQMHKRKKLPCGFCGAIFKKVTSLTKHTEDHKMHPERATSYTCPICSHIFHRHTHYSAHILTHQKETALKCSLCYAKFYSKILLKKHIKKKHGITTTDEISEASTSVAPVTPKVPKVRKYVHKLKYLKPEQKQQVLEERRFKRIRKVEHHSCDICNYKFFSPQFLYDHYLEKHVKNDDLICPICKKVKKLFGSHEELLKHLKTHALIYKCFCPVCDRGFRQQASLKEHLPLHSHERQFQCEICSRTFRSRGSVFFHKKFVHEERKFMCEYCSLLFPLKNALKNHILKKHTDIVPHVYECNTCSKTFTTKQYLRKHEFIHKDSKPYRCIKCNKGFIDLYFYRLHLRKVCKVSDDDIVFFRPPFPT